MIHVVHHADYVAPAPARSTYRWNKNGLIRDLLLARGDAVAWHEPGPTPREWLEAVHDPDYVAEVIEARVPPLKERRIGFPVSPAVARRAAIVPDGTWLAAMLALRHGFAANTAGGSHHALADTGAGYCVFNDLAVAAVRLIETQAVERILVVDCDVHQGDGTAALLAGRPDIATYSIHAEKNFPARKARSTLDVALPDGVDDAGYLATLEGLVRRERLIAGLAIARGIPLASTVGGGYGDDALEIAERHVTAILTLGAAFLENWGTATAAKV